MIDYILISVAFIWIIAAIISDLKTREIPNWLNYSLIAIAISLRTMQSITTKDLYYFVYTLIGLFIFLAISSLMYYTKQWGGGDAKLLTGLGAIFATYPQSLLKFFDPNLNIPFLVSFFINLIVIGSIYGLIYAIALSIKNKNDFLKELKKTPKKGQKFVIITSLILIITSFIFSDIRTVLILTTITYLILYYLIILIKVTEKVCLFKKIPPEKLTEGDWVTDSIYDGKKLIYSSKSPCVNKKQIKQIIELKNKKKLKEITVKEGIPFTPSFLFALIISLIYGNIILLPF